MEKIILIICGYIIGRVYSYYKNRVQCVNCGSHNTYSLGAGYGGEGGIYKFAVKHWEGHLCKKCSQITSVKMSFTKN